MSSGCRCLYHQFIYSSRISAFIHLRYPPHTQKCVGVASQHEFLERANFIPVARLCRPKDTLSQVTDLPVDLAPVDACPIGRPLGSVCVVISQHLTFPSISNPYLVLWVAHQVHVSTLSGWVFPIQPVMDSRCLSAAGLRFLDLPIPTEEFGCPRGWLTGEYISRPHWGYHVPHRGAITGVGVLFTPGSRCPLYSVTGLYFQKGIYAPSFLTQ